ncbi:MAG: hypothetical protein QGG40_16215, partial [Myxococcota bacterium]|nr:hypothetical protein [Myxococcota bacterium]
MSEHAHETLMNRELRLAWLEVGGFVAAADGLSDEEATQLAGSAAGPDLDQDACMAAIQAGAARDSLPDATLALVRDSDPFIRVLCLTEVFSAAESDGISDEEWARLRDTASQVLGSGKVDDFVRLCELQLESDRLFSAIV